MKKLLIIMIRAYQRGISAGRPPSCRFVPSCSSYAIQAIERFGVIKGSGLAVWRILRCNPFGKTGYDPVPEKKQGRIKTRIQSKENNLADQPPSLEE